MKANSSVCAWLDGLQWIHALKTRPRCFRSFSRYFTTWSAAASVVSMQLSGKGIATSLSDRTSKAAHFGSGNDGKKINKIRTTTPVTTSTPKRLRRFCFGTPSQLFFRSDALSRQLSAPLVDERRQYLVQFAAQGVSKCTLRMKARLLLSIGPFPFACHSCKSGF